MQSQQQGQPKNFFLFLLITTGILIGWFALQPILFPTNEENKDKQAQKDDNNGTKKEEPISVAKAFRELSKKDNEQLLARMEGVTSTFFPGIDATMLLRLKRVFPKPGPVKPKKIVKAGPPPKLQTLVLGKKDYYIQAVLTNYGAGVQRLTLTKFDAANWYGKPALNTDGTRKKLDLIQEDPFNPSYRMYHYPDPTLEDRKQRNPLIELGDRIWNHDAKLSEKLSKGLGTKTLEDDEHVLVFRTRGPEGYEHLEIRKIYSLKPKWYHVGLRLEIENTEPSAVERPAFRYQLTGAHGLPVEGVWYTYVHREAMIGMLDEGGTLHRREDGHQYDSEISFWDGGDRVPEASRGSDAILYGGVNVQYFTSMIAVDNQQAEGVDWRNILAFARPSLEAEEIPCRIDKIAKDKKSLKVTFLQGGDNVIWDDDILLLPRAVEELDEKGFKAGDEAVLGIYINYRQGKRILIAGTLRRGTVEIAGPSRAGLRFSKIGDKGYVDISVRMISEPVDTPPGKTVAHQFVLYQGPVKVRQLRVLTGDQAVNYDLVERYAATLQLATLKDYPTRGTIGDICKTIYWTDLLILTSKIMHWLLNTLYWVINLVNPIPFLISSEGLSVILLTVMVRGMMFPISRRQALISIRMQQLQPQMKELREKYKDDAQQLNKEIWALYRKHKVNPLGGCLPLFLQLPIFLGLYYSLQESIRFRLANFLWIENLGAPDMLIWWTENIPVISDIANRTGGFLSFLYLGPYFNLLPIIAVVIMLFHQKLMMPPPTDDQQEMQQKMMKYMMIVFGIMFYKVAAGLCIYFIASSMWGMAERKLLPKKKIDTGDKATAGAPPPSRDGVKKNGPKPKPRSGKKKGKRRPAKKEEPQSNGAIQKVRNWWDELLKQAQKKNR